MSLKNTIVEVIGIADPGTRIIKAAADLVDRGKALMAKPDPDVMALKLHISELQQELVASKQAYMAVYDALLELKRKAEQAEKFEMDAERYTLTKTDMGAFVYTLRPEHARGEPIHEVCTSCFEKQVKSVLQPTDFNRLGCSLCGATFLKSDGQSGIMIGSVRRSSRYD